MRLPFTSLYAPRRGESVTARIRASLYALLRGESVAARIRRAAAHLRLDLVEKQVARLVLREHLRADVGAGVEYTKHRGTAGIKRVYRARK